MKYHHVVPVLLSFAIAAVMFLCPSAFADSTYDYQGQNFSIFTGSDSCNAGVGQCAVTFTMTLSQALGSNFSGEASPLSFSMTDGSTVITQNTAGLSLIDLFFNTNSAGAITQWNVDVANPSTELSSNGFSFGSGACGPEVAADVTTSAANCAATPVGVVGTWTNPTMATPEPSSNLLLLGGLFGLLVFSRRSLFIVGHTRQA